MKSSTVMSGLTLFVVFVFLCGFFLGYVLKSKPMVIDLGDFCLVKQRTIDFQTGEVN